MDHKKTHKWAWPRLRDPISNFSGLLITGKTSKVNYSILTKFTTTCNVDCTEYNTTKTTKRKKGDITLHYIDILAMW